MIVLIHYINLLNLSWIRKCRFKEYGALSYVKSVDGPRKQPLKRFAPPPPPPPPPHPSLILDCSFLFCCHVIRKISLYASKWLVPYLHHKDLRSGIIRGEPNELAVSPDFSSHFVPYFIYPTYSDRQAWANSVDPDQTPQNAASDLGLHRLPLIQQCFRHINRL